MNNYASKKGIGFLNYRNSFPIKKLFNISDKTPVNQHLLLQKICNLETAQIPFNLDKIK